MEVDTYLRRKFEGAIKEVEVVFREDLDLVRRCLLFHSMSKSHSGSGL